MRSSTRCAIFALALLPLAARAAEVAFEPRNPTRDDRIAILVLNCAQGGVMHWGVNARGNSWQQAIPAYRPEGSVMDGVATRTRFRGPDSNGVCSIALGPFDDAEQAVGSVDFAIQWDDGTWDTADGRDYHVPVTQARIGAEPSGPDVNDAIRMTVRRAKPGGELRWGVNAAHGAWEPPHSNYWPRGSVPSDDGFAVDSPLPPPGPNGETSITLGPFDDPAQVVTSLHMAVHWGDEWDTDLGRNYNVGIALPAGLSLYRPLPGEAVTGAVPVEVSGAGPVTLWLDGEPLVTLLVAPCVWEIPDGVTGLGRHVLIARGESNGLARLARREFWSVPELEPRAAPPGARPGATVGEDGLTTFLLYAPGKHFVSVAGDFNDWNERADFMHPAGDGSWWLRKKLGNGTWRYQYVIDGEKRLADPYSGDVEWKDEDGKETHVPAMARSVIEVGAPPFAWSAAAFRRAPLDRLLVYEFHIDDVAPGGGFTGVIAKLDYIRDLGVNAIEPLPFNEFTGDHSWGYNPAFHLAPESSYGTPAELKRLVDEAHRRGLAVIMDVVLNHMCWNSPLFQLYGLDYDASPYFRLFLGENWGFPDLDQESEAFKGYVAEMLRHWVEEYRMDGFRYDATRWTGWQGYNDWGASWFAWAAKQADPGSIQIAEHLPAEAELINDTEMDTTWDAHFRWRLREMLRDARLDRAEFARILDPRTSGFTNAAQRMAYTESHDEERVMRELLDAGYAGGEAVRRATAALAVTLTAPGAVMVYAGQEFGEDTPKVVGSNPLRWEKLETAAGRTLRDAFRKLARLRTAHPAMGGGEVSVIAAELPPDVGAFVRTAHDSAVVVAVNFGREERRFSVPLSVRGAAEDVLGDGFASVGASGAAVFALPPGGAAVLAIGGAP